MGVVICLKRCADLHTAEWMPLPLTVSCFSKIQIGLTFLVPAHLGSPGQRAVKRARARARACVWSQITHVWNFSHKLFSILCAPWFFLFYVLHVTYLCPCSTEDCLAYYQLQVSVSHHCHSHSMRWKYLTANETALSKSPDTYKMVSNTQMPLYSTARWWTISKVNLSRDYCIFTKKTCWLQADLHNVLDNSITIFQMTIFSQHS